MRIIMDVDFLAIYFFLAFAAQFLSWKIPFREQAKNNEYAWDLLSVLAGRVFSVIYIALISSLFIYC